MFLLYLFQSASTPEELAHICRTPRRLSWWIWFNITYTKDKDQYGKREYFADPQETLENRKGDCEDFAWLAYKTLEVMDYVPYLLAVQPKNQLSQHMICAYRDEKGWYYMCSTVRLRYCKGAETLEDVAEYACGEGNMRYWTRFEVHETDIKPAKRNWVGVKLTAFLMSTILLAGCVTGYDHWKQNKNGELKLVEKFRTYGAHHTKSTEEGIDTDSKPDYKFIEIVANKNGG